MLISITELKEFYPDKFINIPDKLLERKLAVIEQTIRQYTNNNFIDRTSRVEVEIEAGKIKKPLNFYANINDTILLTNSIRNNGLYTVKNINTYLELNKPLKNDFKATIFRVEYPIDVIDGAIDLLDYEVNGAKDRTKDGIASETISRHSVSYVNRNSNNTVAGYPAELFSFTKNYIKARF